MGGRLVHHPVLMWVAALDLVLEKLLVEYFPFERVGGICGAAMVRLSLRCLDPRTHAARRRENVGSAKWGSTKADAVKLSFY